jgi:hypothetical protein
MLPADDLNQASDYDAIRRYIYTPIEEAIYLLDSRQKQNLELPYFDVPEPLLGHLKAKDKPYRHIAIMFRQIATPNYEMHRVVELCDKYNLNLLILTIKEDKFCAGNACKHALGRMGFFEGLGRKGGKKIRYSTIIDFNKFNGHPLQECKTFRGQSFVEFHQNLLFQDIPQLNTENIADCSEWFLKQRDITCNWYRANLKLFLKHAILFETFVLSGSELDYTLTYILPAFQEIINVFGVKPLVVHSEAPDREGDEYWQLYPDHLYEFAPYDRRRTPRYEAPFDTFMPTRVGCFNKTKPVNKINRL